MENELTETENENTEVSKEDVPEESSEDISEEIVEDVPEDDFSNEVVLQEVSLDTDSLNHFIELHNDQKQFYADMFWLLIGLIVGYIMIKGLLDQWKS